MNQKDTLAIIAALDRALAVFEGDPAKRATDTRIHDELRRIRAEIEREVSSVSPYSE